MKNGKLNMFLGIGLTISLTINVSPTLAASEGNDEYTKAYRSNGIVEFVPNEDGAEIVDPENPDPENPVDPVDPTDPNGPNPGTSGPLSIDFASSLDFGKNKISTKDEVYYAEPQYFINAETGEIDEEMVRPAYVQVTDNRGTNAGWILTVKEETQLRNENTLNQELIGAEIKFTNAKVVSNGNTEPPDVHDITLVPGETSIAMAAAEDTGAGTWINRFGTVDEMEVDGEVVQKNTSITLSVPGSIPKDAVGYRTELTWTLTDVPENSFDFKGRAIKSFAVGGDEFSGYSNSTSAIITGSSDNVVAYSSVTNPVDYSSNGAISFVEGGDGSIEDDTNNSVEDNNSLEDNVSEGNGSSKPDSHKDNEQTDSGNNQSKKESNNTSQGTLPQTSERSSYLMSIGGFILIALLSQMKNKKTKKVSEE